MKARVDLEVFDKLYQAARNPSAEMQAQFDHAVLTGAAWVEIDLDTDVEADLADRAQEEDGEINDTLRRFFGLPKRDDDTFGGPME